MKKFLIFIFSLSIISIIFVAFFSDTLIKKTFESILSSNLNREVNIGDFDVGYLSGEVNLKKIEINNKDFPGKLLVVDRAFAKLDALSFYEDVIVIDNIVLDGISVNYFFDITNRARSNFTSLKRTLPTVVSIIDPLLRLSFDKLSTLILIIAFKSTLFSLYAM